MVVGLCVCVFVSSNFSKEAKTKVLVSVVQAEHDNYVKLNSLRFLSWLCFIVMA